MQGHVAQRRERACCDVRIDGNGENAGRSWRSIRRKPYLMTFVASMISQYKFNLFSLQMID